MEKDSHFLRDIVIILASSAYANMEEVWGSPMNKALYGDMRFSIPPLCLN